MNYSQILSLVLDSNPDLNLCNREIIFNYLKRLLCYANITNVKQNALVMSKY